MFRKVYLNLLVFISKQISTLPSSNYIPCMRGSSFDWSCASSVGVSPLFLANINIFHRNQLANSATILSSFHCAITSHLTVSSLLFLNFRLC